MVLGDIKNGLNPLMKIPKMLKSAAQPRKQHHDPIFDMIFGQGDKSRKEAASRQLALEESKHNLELRKFEEARTSMYLNPPAYNKQSFDPFSYQNR